LSKKGGGEGKKKKEIPGGFTVRISKNHFGLLYA
jgi:hypothetical protein